MPRYFMSLRYRGRLFADEEGDELPDDERLAHTPRGGRDLIANGRLTTIRNWLDCIFEITDESGRLVAEVLFADAARLKSSTL